MKKAVCLVGALVFTLPPLLMTAVRAEVIKLQAELKGSNEVPPNASSGSGKAAAFHESISPSGHTPLARVVQARPVKIFSAIEK